MSRDLSRYFSCETYLVAYAGGSRDGFVREHVDNCSFCEALVYGGTEEFPLSFEEEVAQVRAERERILKAEGRRRFLKIGAAVVLGLATIGTTGVIASKIGWTNKAVKETRAQQGKLDELASKQGDPAIVAYFDQANPAKKSMVLEWIGDQQRDTLLGVVVGALGDYNPDVRADAVACLLSFPKAKLTPWKTQIVSAESAAGDPDEKRVLSFIISQIP